MSLRPLTRHLWATAALIVVAASLGTSCNRKTDPAPAETVSEAPEGNTLPSLDLSDDTADLLLTWLDDKGDFHVAHKPADIPEASRQKVRVVITPNPNGTGRIVYVADLSSKGPDGKYPVQTMTRAQWNELGADLRKVRMDVVLAQASKGADAGAPHGKADKQAKPGEPDAAEKRLNAKVRAVVYGADWCKPCHDAEAYLKKLGVDVTKKDIEESRAARAEMTKKLTEVGRMGASIPVIDVGGKILIGFSPGAVSAAVRAARKPETL
jgi:glutaredoxin